MPIYGFCCPCGAQIDHYFKISDEKKLKCHCGREAVRVYSFSVKADIVPYKDIALGHVKSRKHKEEIMKKRNLRQFDLSEIKDPKIKESMAKDVDEYKHRQKKGEDIKYYT